MSNWIMTYSGIHFPLVNPKPEHFKLEDIAHALSLINRYGGHTRYRYSVALHCLLGAEKMRKDGHSFLLQLYFMLHDATEAYYGDIPRPLKNLIKDVYEPLEDYALVQVWAAFGLRPPTDDEWAVIKYYDNLMLANEIPKLMPRPHEFEDTELRDDQIPIIMEYEKRVEGAFIFTVNELLERILDKGLIE